MSANHSTKSWDVLPAPVKNYPLGAMTTAQASEVLDVLKNGHYQPWLVSALADVLIKTFINH